MSAPLEVVRQDAKHALRGLIHHPGFTAATVLTFAIGIGLSTAVFSLVNAILLRPLPYADGERLVFVRETLRSIGNASAGHFSDWSTQSTVLESTAAIQGVNYNLADSGAPERVRGMRVSQGYFRAAFVAPVVGRYFSDEDEQAARAVAVLSERLWRTRFNADPTIIGRTIRLSDEPFTVVGIAPERYALTDPARIGAVGGFSAQLWTLLTFTPEQRSSYGSHSYLVLAKLRPAISLASAQADLERVNRDIARRDPVNTAGRGVLVQSLETVLTGSIRTPLLLLFAGVTFVLIVGAINIAGLLLARATAREREIAVRSALGGGASRILRQMVTESLTLAMAGGAAGLLVALVMVQFFVTQGPPEIPRLGDARLDPVVLLFSLGVTFLAAMISGLAPAMRASRTSLHSSFQQRAASASSRDRVRTSMVIAEIALTAVMLVASGLLIRSAVELQRVPFGFNAENVLTARIALPAERYESPEVVAATFGRMLDEIRALHGVSYAGASTKIPLDGGDVDARLTVDGRDFTRGDAPSPNVRLVSDGFFASVGMTMVDGRAIQASDTRPGSPRVVVINEHLAKLLWPGESPLGKRISAWTPGPEPEWREVIGVVRDVRTFGRDEPVQPEMFFSYTQPPVTAWNVFQRSMFLVVRALDPENHAAGLRQAIGAVDPTLPLFNLRTLEAVVLESVAGPRFYTQLIVLLAGTGLALATLGLYAVIAYFVAQRRAEIGIRMALGAGRHRVVAMVLGQGLITAVAGSAAGLFAAFFLTRPMRGLLFEVQPFDPQVFAAVGVGLVAVALLACLVPALRAANMNPAASLRGD